MLARERITVRDRIFIEFHRFRWHVTWAERRYLKFDGVNNVAYNAVYIFPLNKSVLRYFLDPGF